MTAERGGAGVTWKNNEKAQGGKKLRVSSSVRAVTWKNNKIRAKREMDMTVSVIFRIAAVGILVTILGQVLKHSGREEQAFLVSLAGLILVLTWIMPYIYDLFMSIQNLFSL